MLVGVAVLGAVAGFGAYLIRYQPLTTNAAGPQSTGDLTATSSAGSTRTVYRAIYRDGQTIGYLFDLTNNGPWGVTIIGVETPAGNTLLRTVAVEMRRDGRCCGADPTDLERFVSFSLSPQEQKLIVVRAEFDNCVGWAAGTVQSFSVPTIRFRVLGVTRRVQLSASWTIQVRSPPDADCPGRSG